MSITVKLDTNKAPRSSLVSCLRRGICEIIHEDMNGNKKTNWCTLRRAHMEDEKKHDWVDHEYDSDILVLWDMNGDEWRGGAWLQVPISRIVHFEQLTGVPQ
jgi:hypothetical protein